MEIISENAMETWKSALKHIFDNGHTFKDTNKRNCREINNLLLEIKNPGFDIGKPVEILNGFQKWVYPPMEEIANIILNRKLSPVYTYSYGPSLFNYQAEVNQVDNFIVPLLKADPTSRRAVAALWDPTTDSNPGKVLVPSLCLIDFKLRKNRLNLTAFVRSNEMFFGWPANIYQLYTLQNYVAKKLDVKPGKLSTLSSSAHIFEDEFEFIKKIIGLM